MELFIGLGILSFLTLIAFACAWLVQSIRILILLAEATLDEMRTYTR